MKTRFATVSTIGLVVGALLTPLAAYPDDRAADRKHPTTFVKDSVITTKVKAKLAEEKISSLTKVHVDTDANGMVLLTGTVNSNAEADKAVSIAKATEGVTSVSSKLTVKKDK
jgi:hyperosmotically inducible protein